VNYTERQEGPDGQHCDLLTRVPYDRQRMIETAMSRARTVRDQQDAALRGLLWEASVKDTLTGEMTSDVDRAGAEVIQPWRERAVELYNEWYAVAFPGPKGFSRTASRTPPSGKTRAPSETSEPS
jgi:hypothetical protein